MSATLSAAPARAKKRIREAALHRLRGGPRTRQQNAELAALLRDLGALAAEVSASAAWPDIQLTRAVLDLQAEVATDRLDEDDAVALSLGRRPWHAAPSQAWDALLVVGQRARWAYPEVGERVARVLLAARPGDAAAREVARDSRRRADKLSGQGWRERSRRRPADGELPRLLDALDGGAASATPAGPDADGWLAVEQALRTDPDALVPAAVPTLRRSYFGDERADAPFLVTTRAVLARGLTAGSDVSPLQELLDAAATELGAVAPGAALPGEPLAVRTVGTAGLREYLDGRSVALVANSADLLDLELGPEIDSYDVVVRFNSFLLDPRRTGTKTDVHATIHLHDFNWDVPVDGRLVFGGAAPAWTASLARHLRPGAQQWVGDESVRWPRRTLLDPGTRELCTVPTTGLNTLLLLDYLDVSTRIDLFGFNFHTGAPLRRPEAMHLPVAEAHSYDAEREWVARRTVDTAPGRISLR
ncbi:glycosyltransferase family 29 protein [Isoptericola sp. 4D.3]|uniref:Glycosyltransferase family 29 protein n=1 Tax=Isoptericola peretonis TaxID=2918523 RepID=A0ABT0J679_9MICO|nr:glycosyltransferase family 29 protein [Isoptericola sp. 4D.3]